MAILKSEQIEERQAVIEKAILTQHGELAGWPVVRHITPLVMVALQRANNPYITGKVGFDAIGINFDEGGKIANGASFAIAMMPKTAEVLVLLACSRDELKAYSVNPEALASAALDVVEDNTSDFLASATVFVSEEMHSVMKSKATLADEKPSAEALSGGEAKKKRNRTG